MQDHRKIGKSEHNAHGRRKQNNVGGFSPRKKNYGVSIYTNSTHQYVIGLVNITKDNYQLSALMVQMVKRVSLVLTRSTRVRIHLFGKLFFSLFKFQITSEKHLFIYHLLG